MSEDTDAKHVGRPQRTTRSERRRSRRPGEDSADPGASDAAAQGADDEAASYDTLVDVDVAGDDEAAPESPADPEQAPSEAAPVEPHDAAESVVAADAPTDTFEALDDDDSRPTREMTVVPLELSEDDKTMPRIRVEDLATRMQAAPSASTERADPPPVLPPPVVARAEAATEPERDEATHPRIVVTTTSVVIAPSRVIGIGGTSSLGDVDVAPRMASRPPPPSTPVASAPAIPVTIPRPPLREPLEARDRELPLPLREDLAPPLVAVATPATDDDVELAAEDTGVVEGEVDEHIVDVDVAEIESSREARTPPPPPAPDAKVRASAPPKRPPPPPAAPAAAAAPPLAPPVAALPIAAAVAPPPAPPAPPLAAAAAAAAPIASSQPAAVPKPDDDQKKRKQARQWWERFFSEDYLRAVQTPTPAQIAHQVDFIVESLGLERGATILDVGCGLGLHCVELTRRGYLTVGLDLSLAMITRAAEAAQRQGLKINFLHADIREMQFDGAFDAAICMGTTFGFFDDESNRDVLARLHQALRSGGRLLLDVANRDYVMPAQPNLVWFEGDGCVCMEESDFNHFTSRLTVKRTMMREDGTQSSSEYSLRLYSLHELGQLIQQMGFRVLEVSGQEAVRGAFFGACAPRIMILAERRTPGRLSQVMPPERPSSELLRPLPQERGSAELPKPPKPPGASGS